MDLIFNFFADLRGDCWAWHRPSWRRQPRDSEVHFQAVDRHGRFCGSELLQSVLRDHDRGAGGDQVHRHCQHVRYCRQSTGDRHSRYYQVWSLAQFYSVDFSKSRIGVKKCVFNKCTIKVCVSCCWRCPGTSAPSAAHLMVSLYLCSSGSNARGESRAGEGRRVSSKSPSRVRDGDKGVAGRNWRE